MIVEKTPKREVLFWEKVDKTPGHGPQGECWLWTGAKNEAGYGWITVYTEGKQRFFFVHKVSYEWENGDIPSGTIIRHTCDTPLCVRPSHLIPGTHQDNTNDKMERGRYVSAVATITEEDAVAIRYKKASGVTTRELCEEYNFSTQHVNSICRGVYWPHSGGPLTSRFLVSDSIIYEVLADSLTMSNKLVAEKNDLSVSVVQQITSGTKIPKSTSGIDFILCGNLVTSADQIALLSNLVNNPLVSNEIRQTILQDVSSRQ